MQLLMLLVLFAAGHAGPAGLTACGPHAPGQAGLAAAVAVRLPFRALPPPPDSGSARCGGMPAAVGATDGGAMRLRGGGRSWIRKTVKAASKKERQRKKRNIDNTNLRASVKLDPASVPPALLLQTELEHQAEQWLLGGCRPEALPTVEPLKAIEAAKLRLQAMPDKPPRAPRTIKDRQAEEDDAMRVDADDRGDGDDVGSKGSRSIRPGRGLNSAASSRKAAHIKQGPRSNGKRGGMRLRGGAPGDSEDESSSVVSDDSSSVVSSSSSSAFALPVATNLPAKRSTAAEDARTRASEPPPPLPSTTRVGEHRQAGIGNW